MRGRNESGSIRDRRPGILGAITLRLMLIAGLLLWPAGCQADDASWQRVQAAGVLKVGLDPTYPPFATAAADGVYGLDVDLARALAADLGLEVEFVLFGYDGLYDALATKQVDVLISALVIMPEKQRDFAYSQPYFNAGEILVIPAAAEDIQGREDLAGRTLAVELGALGHVEATDWAKSIPDLAVSPYPTADEALTAVAAGGADAALVDAISGRLFLAQTPALKQVADPVTVEPFALVTRIEDGRLLAQLDQALVRLKETGTLEQIVADWLGQ